MCFFSYSVNNIVKSGACSHKYRVTDALNKTFFLGRSNGEYDAAYQTAVIN